MFSVDIGTYNLPILLPIFSVLYLNMYNNNRGGFSGGNRSFGGPRRDFGGGGGGEERKMYSATCDKCGRPCELPFRPNGRKPVYCSNCFEKEGGGAPQGENRSFGGERSFSSRPRVETRNYDQPDYGRQFNELNAKLDKLISLLSGDTAVAPAPKKKKEKKEVKAEAESMPEARVEIPEMEVSEEK